MDIPIEIPSYGAMIIFVIVFASMNYKANERFDKIGSIIILVFFSFCAGFVTYANMLEHLKH